MFFGMLLGLQHLSVTTDSVIRGVMLEQQLQLSTTEKEKSREEPTQIDKEK